MELTGKAKQEFEEWYQKTDFNSETQPMAFWFYRLPFSMQWGVYVDFFDKKNIDIDVFKIDRDIDYNEGKIGMYAVYVGDREGDYKTREEARKKAIESANELYNENKH